MSPLTLPPQVAIFEFTRYICMGTFTFLSAYSTRKTTRGVTASLSLHCILKDIIVASSFPTYLERPKYLCPQPSEPCLLSRVISVTYLYPLMLFPDKYFESWLKYCFSFWNVLSLYTHLFSPQASSTWLMSHCLACRAERTTAKY